MGLHIGSAVRRLREEQAILQKDFADACGIGSSYLSLVENGHKIPSLTLISVFAHRLEVSEAYLLFEAIELPQSLSSQDKRVFDKARCVVKSASLPC